MPLPSFLQRKKSTKPADRRPSAAPDDSGPVQAARARARRRLIGAVVLLAIGIIGFPLVFETQPRPVAVDIPIEMPPKKNGGSVAPPPARPMPVTPAPKASAPVLAELPPERAEAPAAAAPAPTPAPVPTPAPAPAPAPVTHPPPAAVAKADDGSRAKALLDDGPSASAPKAGRFVVQVGAYTDANALREARQKVEKLGLKTYTQVVETDAGKRTRVRVGPFATREEADGAGAKLKAAGLPVAILTL